MRVKSYSLGTARFGCWLLLSACGVEADGQSRDEAEESSVEVGQAPPPSPLDDASDPSLEKDDPSVGVTLAPATPAEPEGEIFKSTSTEVVASGWSFWTSPERFRVRRDQLNDEQRALLVAARVVPAQSDRCPTHKDDANHVIEVIDDDGATRSFDLNRENATCTQGAEIIDYESFKAFLETFDCQPDPFPDSSGLVRGFWPSSSCEHWVYRPQAEPLREEGLVVEHSGRYVVRILECNGIEVNTVILDEAQSPVPTTPLSTDNGCPALEVELAAGKYPLRFEFAGEIAGVFYVGIEEVAP